MRLAYFDCHAGVSGDMILGALVDAGLQVEVLQRELDKLGLEGVVLQGGKVQRHGIAATKIDVVAEEGHHHRRLQDVLGIIDAADISSGAKRQTGAIFRRLAEAEAEVHGISVDRVHFHEVGAADAITDIAGAVIGLEQLGVERVYASRLRFGRGTTRSAHGVLPVPVPAVVALCRDVAAERTEIPYELVTPTGAAILTTLAEKIGAVPPPFRTRRIGYGAGSRDMDQIPNLLRLEIGESESSLQTDTLTLIETNIDDMSPEIYGFLIDRLFTEGARDAYLTPVIMKKGRPGVVLSVLADPDRTQSFTDLIFRETTTLGIRIRRVERQTISRRREVVETAFGPVAVKVASYGGRTRLAPEFEDCARIASKQDVPILEVYRAASNADIG
ncbi:MAG: nickel pincer cofactor biosynthesis protein LarC [Gemmatimonadetes bacterium]|nr:nickel pincer cofactor biosynthesis protein LarC [Gemmatimonadota bacterium]MDE3256521.1 nickel pincer cofactor biosynthesis protein LarC [Gemmatimonadota bacterium]